MSETFYVYTDGSCKSNGKKNAIGGIGVYFPNNTNLNLSEKWVSKDKVTNQKTELLACIRALEVIKENELDKNCTITIVSDSRYTIDCMINWIINWKENNWKKSDGKPVLNQDLIKKLDNLMQSMKNLVFFKHINSHKPEPVNKESKNWKHWYGNDQADKLANKCLFKKS